jgi:amino acid adenylation domain-containing protein
VGVLGILKAGAAYLPLDPAYPAERLTFMLEDAQAQVILTQPELIERLGKFSGELVLLGGDAVEWVSDESANQKPETAVVTSPENLAYVIYTSGSTGTPKGIAMIHRALVNLITWQLKNSNLPAQARTLQFSSLSFDVSFQEMFSTWCSGGTLVLITESVRRNPLALWHLTCERQIHRLFLPFVALQQVADVACNEAPGLSALREIVTAGEQLRITPRIKAFFRRLPGATLHNQYGPSESHVVTDYRMSDSIDDWPNLPAIGGPIANTQVYLLNENLDVVPIGELGELYLGGVCLARGYLGRPELTAEYFIPQPFSKERGARLYKTGDHGRYLQDGLIEFIGRADNQVKIRGFRVEIGEIEAVLSHHPSVRENAVVARDAGDGQKRLVAFVVPLAGQTPKSIELRSYLHEKLNDYMVPSTIVFLERLPLTPSGKVNRRALPEIETKRPELETAYVGPRTELEQAIASIWQQLLGIDEVGMADNFFDLGGNSLQIVQLHTKLKEYLKKEIPVTTLFQYSTIASLSKHLSEGANPGVNLQEAHDRALRQKQVLSRQLALKRGNKT